MMDENELLYHQMKFLPAAAEGYQKIRCLREIKKTIDRILGRETNNLL